MQDEEFLLLFENCSLKKAHFKHQSHLRVAWLYLSEYVFDHAIIRTTQGICCYATSLGAAHIYHETLTRVWVHLVHHAMYSKAKNFYDFIAENQYLLDKTLPLQYYSQSRLDSSFARSQWIEPDLKPLYA